VTFYAFSIYYARFPVIFHLISANFTAVKLTYGLTSKLEDRQPDFTLLLITALANRSFLGNFSMHYCSKHNLVVAAPVIHFARSCYIS
jgi:hypothetical protein